MPWPAFCSLLGAAGRIRAREEQAAIAAASYPYMKEADQRRVHASLAEAAQGMAQAVETTDDQAREALDVFKMVAKRHRQLYGGMPDALKIPMKGKA